jgi:hypothetical protein
VAQIHYLRFPRRETSAVVSRPNAVVAHEHLLGGAGLDEPLRARAQPVPSFSALVWCGVLLFMLGGMAIMLMTLDEIIGRVTALGGLETRVEGSKQ